MLICNLKTCFSKGLKFDFSNINLSEVVCLLKKTVGAWIDYIKVVHHNLHYNF